MPTQLDPVLALALELRDSLRDSKLSGQHDSDFDEDSERADRLLRLLVNERGDRSAQLTLTKSEVGGLVHIRETMLTQRARDETPQSEILEDAQACIEILDPLINRFFD